MIRRLTEAEREAINKRAESSDPSAPTTTHKSAEGAGELDSQVNVIHVGDLQVELLEDFFGGFTHHAGANLHAKVLYGRSNHHKIEAIFKCFARAMRYACSTDERLKDQLPSTKGLL